MLMRFFTIFLNFFAGRLLNNTSSFALADAGLKKMRKAALSFFAVQVTLILFTVALFTLIADIFYISKTQNQFGLSELGYVSGGLLAISAVIITFLFRKRSWTVSDVAIRSSTQIPQNDSALSQAIALLVLDMVEERRYARKSEHVVPEQSAQERTTQTFSQQYSEKEGVEALYN